MIKVKSQFIFLGILFILFSCEDPLYKYMRSGHVLDIQMTSDGAKFIDRSSGQIFEPRGVNYQYPVLTSGGYYQDRVFGTSDFDAARVDRDFATLASYGFNTVRIFLDLCNDDPSCIGNESGGLNTSYLQNIVTTMELASTHGLLLLLTSNDLPSQGGYWNISDSDAPSDFGPYRNRHYLTANGVEAGRQYWQDLMSGLEALGAPFETVLGWSLLNEQWYDSSNPPFSLTSGLVTCANGNTYDMAIPGDHLDMAADGLVYYIHELGEVIKTYVPQGFITMGFFAPNYPNTLRTSDDFRYVETQPILYRAEVDFFDFHPYPGSHPLDEHVVNYGMTGYTDKPIIMGEVGAFQNTYATMDDAVDGLVPWIAESCQKGFDGWLYWMYYPFPVAGDITWSFSDTEGDKLMEAMSFSRYPDFCADDIILENVATDSEIYASSSLPEEQPEMAIDGARATQWGAGAHPVQWIELDFGREIKFKRLKLVVAQHPPGETTHEIWTYNNAGIKKRIYRINDSTFNNQVIDWRLSFSIPDVRRLRLLTKKSPSWVAWKEIEVYE
ncbi:MAG: discoidin domain-containing protein [Fulvivirga sp.]